MTDEEEKVGTAVRGLRTRLTYMLDLLTLDRPMRIADIGANPINIPDYTEMQKLGGCEVWGFEPDEDAFAALQKDALPGSHFVQRAVGKPGKAKFYGHPQSGLGSLLKIDKASVAFLSKPGWHAKQREGIDVKLVSLDKLPEKEMPKPDLLKMDIQGGELDVFQHGRKKLSQAVCVVTEVRFSRIYENEPMWSDIDIELRDQGFALHKLMFTKAVLTANSLNKRMRSGRFRNQLMDGDAVYIRDPLTIADWTDAQVKHLALSALGMFNSIDMVVFALDELVRRDVLPADAPEEFFNTLPRWMRK